MPYGQERWNNGGSVTDFGFTSQRRDSYIKLYDYGARWYDPLIGRFISPDTIIPDPADSQSFNRYAYVNNNPLNYIDPSGHEPCDNGNWGDCQPESSEPFTPPDADGEDVSDIVRQYDPNYGNPYYNDPNYSNDPTVSANFSIWRGTANGCWKCHVTHDTGNVPTNSELSGYNTEFWHEWDDFGVFVKLTGLGLHSTQTQLGNSLTPSGVNEVPANTPVGRKGNPINVPPRTNQPAEIGGRSYSGHSLDRMQSRGFVPSVVEDTISAGQSAPGNVPNSTTYYNPNNNITVVLNDTGRVTTVRYGSP